MRKIICGLILGGFLVACSSPDNAVMTASVAIAETGWEIDEPIKLSLDIPDTAQRYDFYITLRHNTDYEWMNLFLFLKTYYPNMEFSRDTLECFLADESGRWFGKGGSSVKDCMMLFKKDLKFPQVGHYQFEFTQGMRSESLKNLMDLGVRVVAVEE